MLFLAALLGTVAVVLSFACTSRQKNPIQRTTFVDIYSIVCVSGLLPDSAVWHVARHLRQHVLEFHGWAISRTFDVSCFRSSMSEPPGGQRRVALSSASGAKIGSDKAND